MLGRGKVYNRFFNEEEWAKVNPDNKELMEDFIEEYKQQKKKESTIKQYKNDLRIVLIYILRELNNKSIIELTKKHFRKFSLYLSEEMNMSNARVNRLMSCTRSLLTFAEDDDDYEYDNNIAKKVKGLPKQKVKTNEDDFFLSHEQVMKLREELLKRDRLQDAVLLMLSYDSGGRRNEIFQVQKHGLTEDNKTNKVIGKRGKEFKLVYLDDTKELIKQWLDERGEDDIDSLWIAGKGDNKREILSGTLYDRVVSMSRVLSEIEEREINFFPHTLRHSRAEALSQGTDTRIVDENGNPKKFPLDQVKLVLNHQSVSTTELYVKDHTEDQINEMFGF